MRVKTSNVWTFFKQPASVCVLLYPGMLALIGPGGCAEKKAETVPPVEVADVTQQDVPILQNGSPLWTAWSMRPFAPRCRDISSSRITKRETSSKRARYSFRSTRGPFRPPWSRQRANWEGQGPLDANQGQSEHVSSPSPRKGRSARRTSTTLSPPNSLHRQRPCQLQPLLTRPAWTSVSHV